MPILGLGTTGGSDPVAALVASLNGVFLGGPGYCVQASGFHVGSTTDATLLAQNDAAMAAAITASQAVSGAVLPIYLPAGIIDLATSISVTNDLTLIGSNPMGDEFATGTVLRNRTGNLFTLTADRRRVKFEGITFSGSSSNVNTDFIPAQDLTSGYILYDFTMIRCGVIWFANALHLRVSRFFIKGNYFNHCTAERAHGLVSLQGSDGRFSENYIDTDQSTLVGEGIYGLYLESMGKSVVADNYITPGPHSGLAVVSGRQGLVIENNRIDGLRNGDIGTPYTYTDGGVGRTTGPGIFTQNCIGVRLRNNYVARVLAQPTASRTVTDGVTTSGSAVITSATAAFGVNDIGKNVSGTGIPASTRLLSVQSSTAATLSAAASADGTGVSIAVAGAGDGAVTHSNPAGVVEDGTVFDYIVVPTGATGSTRYPWRFEGAAVDSVCRVGRAASFHNGSVERLRQQSTTTIGSRLVWDPWTRLASHAGAVSDSDFPTYVRSSDGAALAVPDGAQGLDTTNNRLYSKVGGVWKYADLT